jgi:hypothetical protein
MPPSQTFFMLITNPEKISAVLEAFPTWANIFIKCNRESFFVNSVKLQGRTLSLKFESQVPAKDLVLVHFEIGKTGYYFDGLLEKQGDGFRIQLGSLNQEQSRKIPRMNVPTDYPAHFVAQKLNGKEVSFESHLIDINGSGIQFSVTPVTPVKIGDHMVGIVKINKFKEVKLSGTVRHFRTHGNATYAGLEFNHREFGSENDLLELLAFFQHDVFYFNKKKAAG